MKNLFVQLTPPPAQFAYLPDWFGPRVEIEVEDFGIPPGVWLQVNDHTTKRLQMMLKRLRRKPVPSDHEKGQVERIEQILSTLELLPRQKSGNPH